jgi:hypothetical protein
MKRGTIRLLRQSKRYSPRIGKATIQIGKCVQICLETCEVNETDEIDVGKMMQYTKETEEMSYRRTVICISAGNLEGCC